MTYGLQGGSYGTINNKAITWIYCRDIFHAQFKNKQFLFFTYEKLENILKFFTKVENILGIGKKLKCCFQKTNVDNTFLIRPGLFWGEKNRIHLLTILLRTAQKYNSKLDKDKDFWATCNDNDYLSQTWLAFNKFMEGNTEIRDNYFFGWVRTFQNGRCLHLIESSVADKKRQALKKKFDAKSSTDKKRQALKKKFNINK